MKLSTIGTFVRPLYIIDYYCFLPSQEISYLMFFHPENYLIGTVPFVNIFLPGETEAGNRGDDPARDSRLQWVV
jgi:hypothetical protein